ncbi:MAG: ABC transporter ATP-binding protein [Halobacteriaceae archaeon]
MTPAVVAEGVRKAYGDTVALDGVDLSVAEGEVFGLIGPNGAGKTTLVRCLTGTARPDSGRVAVLGETPAGVSAERVGLLPQSFAPAARLTGRELVAYYAGLYDDARDPDAVLDDVGLDDRATRYEALSGGQKRRVCVAAAVVNDPDVLFLDEPTTGIDPAGRRAVRRVVGRLVDRGTTVLLTTHDMAEAETLADRVALLAAGDVAAVGTPGDLVNEYAGERRLYVETDADAADLTAVEARDTDHGVVVVGVTPAEIGTVVDAIEATGANVAELTWREPGLEDVYLELTGADVSEVVA